MRPSSCPYKSSLSFSFLRPPNFFLPLQIFPIQWTGTVFPWLSVLYSASHCQVRLLLPTAFHTSSLPAHLPTNPAPDCPAGPSLVTKTQPCVLHASAVRVLRIALLSILFLYEFHCICLAFIGTCLITLCNTFGRTKTFSLKRKSSIDSNDSEDSYSIFPSIQIKWSQISASLKTKACKYTIISCFAILHGLH